MKKIVLAAILLFAAMLASRSDTQAADTSGFYLNEWLNQWVNVQAYEVVRDDSWGSGASFEGENRTYGRDWYYSGSSILSIIYWQLGVSSGYSDCQGNGNYQQRWYESDDKYYWEFSSNEINNWHTVVGENEVYPINRLNPFDTCNSAAWRVNLYSQFVETSPEYVFRNTQFTGTGYIACIYVPYEWECSTFF